MPGDASPSEPQEVTLRRISARYDFAKASLWVAGILASYVPLLAVRPIARAFAGKHTNITLTISVSIIVSLALGGGFLALLRKNRAQGGELRRLRARCTRLENDLKALTNGAVT